MRDILVYSNSFEVWSQSVRYAARLAAATQATLTAAYVYPTPELMMPAFGAPALLAEIVTQTRKIERESLAAEQRFVAWAQDLGVARAAWQVAEGYLPEALGQLGNWHDVLVLERSGDIAWESAADLGTLVVQTGLPCLIVPPGEYDPARLDCVALAWNGAYARAIRPITNPWPRLPAPRNASQRPGRASGWTRPSRAIRMATP